MKYVPRILHWYKKMKAYCPIFISVHVLLKWSVWIKSWATEQEQSKSRPAPGKLVVPKGWREALGTSARGRLQKQTWSVSEDMHLKKKCTYYCVYVDEDAMVGRWRSEVKSISVCLSACIWHLVSNPSWMLTDGPWTTVWVAVTLVHCCQMKHFCNDGNVLHLWLEGTQNVGSATDRQNF